MSTPVSAATEGDGSEFVRKWRGAWPEWAIAEVFVPASERELAPYWQALQFELLEAAWGGDDARPGEAKLGWWVEELAGWSQGRRRHPLGMQLLRRPAPWEALARALPTLLASRARPDSEAAAWSTLEAPAGAAARIEGALLGCAPDHRLVAACWLHDRLARHPHDAIPRDLGEAPAAVGAWASRLRGAWPDAAGAPVTRRLEAALSRSRLRSGDPTQARGPLATLWACWRAARD